MSVIADLPDIRPSLLLDFANSRRVHPLMQCTRASTATCFGPDGKLRTVESNVPRIDFDPETGRCLGLLLEEARTNILLQSEGFTNASWAKAAAITVTSDTDGWSTVAHDGSANSQSVTQNNRPNTVNYASVFFDFKSGSLAAVNVTVGFNGTANNGRVAFNFDNGVSSVAGVAGAITNSMITHSMKWMGSFWRCFLSIDITSAGITPATNSILFYPGISATSQTAGNIKVRCCQAEGAKQSSSYIPTTTASVTRAADQLWAVLQQLPPDGYTVLVEGSSSWVGEYPVILSDSPTGLGNYVGIRAAAAGSYINSAESGRSGIASPRPAAGAPFKMAAAISNDASKGLIAVDGVLSAVTSARTAVDFSLRNILKLGAVTGAAQGVNLIRRVAIYPRTLTGAQLQRLTA